MKKLICVLFLSAASLVSSKPASACFSLPGIDVGKVRSVVRQTLLRGEYVLSFRVTWKKKASKGVLFQGIRLHRRIRVLAASGRTLKVKAKGFAPAHTVVAFSRSNIWVTVKVFVPEKDRKSFLSTYKNRNLTLWRKSAMKKGAAFGEYFAPGDGRPKGCVTPREPKWVAKAKPKAKAEDF